MNRKFAPTLAGIGLFAALYFGATLRYPGGNQADPLAPGFDWLQNYWCDLLGSEAENGQPNPARPLAILATGVLCAALANFWWHLAGFLAGNVRKRLIFRASSTLSMSTALILFSDFHDTAILISGISGLAAVAATFVVLRQNGLRRQFNFGLCCMVLVAVNNLIYWPKIGLAWLPIVQKITFLAFLGWVAAICMASRWRDLH